MSLCDHTLLYLTAQTWTQGEASAALAAELMEAMENNVHVLLVHEMPGAGGQAERFGCAFASFFANPDGATPSQLLKRGIYSQIAVPLKGGPWRRTSMALLAVALGMSKEDAESGGDNATRLGESAASKLLRPLWYRSLNRATVKPVVGPTPAEESAFTVRLSKQAEVMLLQSRV